MSDIRLSVIFRGEEEEEEESAEGRRGRREGGGGGGEEKEEKEEEEEARVAITIKRTKTGGLQTDEAKPEKKSGALN